MFKDILYRTISNLGHSLTPGMYINDLEFSYHLREIFRTRRVSCVLDIGANEGQYRNFLRRRCGYTGHIASFEPVKEVFNIVSQRARTDQNWNTYNFALGAKPARMTINVMRDTHFSSFLEPTMEEIEKPDIHQKNVVSRKEEVEVLDLSTALTKLPSAFDVSRLYLKLDTQGYDLEILRGARGVLDQIVAVQIEAPVKPLYSGMVSFSEAIGELSRLGFDVTGLYPVTRDQHQRVIEFDCVAVRSTASRAGT